MARIGPHDMLEPGTKVKCGVKIGFVVSVKEVDAVPCGKIMVHTVRFIAKFQRYPRRRIITLHREIEYEVNYSGIEIYEDR